MCVWWQRVRGSCQCSFSIHFFEQLRRTASCNYRLRTGLQGCQQHNRARARTTDAGEKNIPSSICRRSERGVGLILMLQQLINERQAMHECGKKYAEEQCMQMKNDDDW